MLNTTAAFEVRKMTLNKWGDNTAEVHQYYERFAELVNAHFTASSTTQAATPQINILAAVANLPQDAQARLYQFLYNAGHRIYK